MSADRTGEVMHPVGAVGLMCEGREQCGAGGRPTQHVYVVCVASHFVCSCNSSKV